MRILVEFDVKNEQELRAVLKAGREQTFYDAHVVNFTINPTKDLTGINNKAKELCDAGVCRSMAEARRLVAGGGFDNAMKRRKK